MTVCPFDLVANILDSVIKTDIYPRNQAAIKMLTKLVEHHSTEITDKHLEMLMPGLIQVSYTTILFCRSFSKNVPLE